MLASDIAEASFVRSYKRSFNGFAVYLTDQERQKIAGTQLLIS